MDRVAQELHKPVKRKFPRRPIVAQAVHDIWAADLVDMQTYSYYNSGYKYLITIIDILSRYAFALPIKDKSGSTVASAFKLLFDEQFIVPSKLWTDRGTEFLNSDMNELLRQYSIEIYHTYSENKSPIVERFNRTLKEMMWKYFTANSTYRWIDILPELIHTYNTRKHSTIKMSPAEAVENEEILLERQKERVKSIMSKKVKPKFKVGDHVRISRVKGVFEKGYHPNWSREVYRVHSVDSKFPPVYKLIDDLGNVIDGSFYEQELQKTSEDRTREVEKIIKRRVVDGETQYFVKYKGYSDAHNEWRTAKDFDPDFLKTTTPLEKVGERSYLLGYKGKTPVRHRVKKRLTRKRRAKK